MNKALCVAAALFAAAAPAAPPSNRSHVVVMDNLKFGPAPADLRVGDTIIWRNRDMFRHTATARNGSFDIDLPPGKTGSTTLTRRGRIAYYCKYHPGMTGTLNVQK